MSAIIGVTLFGAAAALFVLFRVIFPDRPGEDGAGELTAQIACVFITALLAGGAGAFIDFIVTHDDAMGIAWFALALIATFAVIRLAIRLGRRARAT